ncbi:mitochondrial carnitine/acylcarnitine carrier protein-like [Ptychodera flava]|uniref:mitochondrial carnitine/acylcarnitine carrier protein-like n=1 Tax=Ptychodera flava TaxID=63121 RepID=UPI00396A1B63
METRAMKDFISGGIGGIFMIVIGQPLDTIKVRLQTQSNRPHGRSPMYKGMVDCAVKSIRSEGVRGLFKGMLTPMLMITPITALYFSGFGLAKKLQQRRPGDELTTSQLFKAGMFSSLVAMVFLVPVERIKCTLQVQQSGGRGRMVMYCGPMDCVRQFYREAGISEFTKALSQHY